MRYRGVMRKVRATNVRNVLTALLVMAMAAVAFGQNIDPRARQLLETLGEGANAGPYRNMDVSMTTTSYMEGEAFEAATRMVVDYENERAAIVSEVMGMATTMLVVDGAVSMKMMGMTVPMPAEMQSEFDSIFEQSTADNLLDNAQSLTFDGPVNYGGVLEGDQVTYVGDASFYGTPDAPEIHYVFSADGALLGMHIPSAEGEMLMVYSEPVRDSLTAFDSTSYMLVDGEWQLVAVTKVESVEFDTVLDETLFQ